MENLSLSTWIWGQDNAVVPGHGGPQKILESGLFMARRTCTLIPGAIAEGKWPCKPVLKELRVCIQLVTRGTKTWKTLLFPDAIPEQFPQFSPHMHPAKKALLGPRFLPGQWRSGDEKMTICLGWSGLSPVALRLLLSTFLRLNFMALWPVCLPIITRSHCLFFWTRHPILLP